MKTFLLIALLVTLVTVKYLVAQDNQNSKIYTYTKEYLSINDGPNNNQKENIEDISEYDVDEETEFYEDDEESEIQRMEDYDEADLVEDEIAQENSNKRTRDKTSTRKKKRWWQFWK